MDNQNISPPRPTTRSTSVRMSGITSSPRSPTTSDAISSNEIGLEKSPTAATDPTKQLLQELQDDTPNASLLLGEAPLEREAGRQIMKAWHELERKEAAKKRHDENGDGNILDSTRTDLDDKLFLTLEDDDDAVLQTRLAQTQAELEEMDAIDHEDKDDEHENENEENSTGDDVISNAVVPGNSSSSRHNDGNQQPATGTVTDLSGQDTDQPLPPLKFTRHRRIQAHRRAESVEQAMFGLLSPSTNMAAINHLSTKKLLPTGASSTIPSQQPHMPVPGEVTDLTQVLSSKRHPTIESPLLLTEVLIDTAQAHVQDIRVQETAKNHKKKLQNTPGREDLPDSDEERAQELQQIVKENGDIVPVISPDDGAVGQDKPLYRIEELQEVDDDDDTISGHGTIIDEETGTPIGSTSKQQRKQQTISRHGLVSRKLASGLQQDWALFHQFLTPRKATMMLYLKVVTLAVVFPSLLIASLVFYLKEHPEQQDKEKEFGTTIIIIPDDRPFISWWFLFLGVRQVVTLTMALVTQALLIDYLALGSRFSLKIIGAAVTLLAVQARGWPCVLFFWAFYDLVLLSGDRPLAHHWGYWQDWIALFNESNHSGDIVQSEWNFKIIVVAFIVAVAVAIKRVVLGLVLARKTLCKLIANVRCLMCGDFLYA